MSSRTSVSRPPVWREIVLGLALFAVYLLVDGLGGPRRRAAATEHAHWVLSAEQWLHLDIEQWANDLLSPHHVLTVAANYEYATTYIISALLLLVLSYWRDPQVYRLTRNSFVVLNLLAMACFWFFPLLPPRMLTGEFVDTVQQHGTIGSWGSPLVSGANQLAAMPSLHMAWALWVSVMLARLSHARWLQVVSGIHVAVTCGVVIATANHYVLDVVGAAVLVGVGVLLAERWTGADSRLATADEFFLNVEKGPNAQNVGGYVHLDLGDGPEPTLDEVRALARTAFEHHPRFVSRLEARGHSHHWVQVTDMDWAAHVSQVTMPPGSGPADLDEAVARIHAERLPHDRPLWRIVLITGLPRGKAVFVVLMHHCMADGIGGIGQLLSLMRPVVALPSSDHEPPRWWQSCLAVTAGLAQLATDGGPSTVLSPSRGSTALGTLQLDFAQVRRVAAAHEVRVTELLLALIGSAVAGTDPALAARLEHRLRVSVPIMVARPDQDGGAGNSTAAAIIDAPCRDAPLCELLPEAQELARSLRTPTRALASRWVMAKALRFLPAAGRSAFARTVYGRRFFHATVSNLPGPRQHLTLLGARMDQVYPLLPPAPSTPVTVGALTWGDDFGLGITTDPDLLDASQVAAQVRARIAEAAAELSQDRVVP